ncbi:hypothetical protein QM588_22755 [Rhodococcus sp. IEGM 1354]|uniref:hypothetical protein n=1 Tax=Rhodococcus sp. IEGM 1354 TaxID=3047088 RepID=UPI0024B7193E|nr:hypothetical protein [Rhodococcus sp. IEGM 1354]MDI9933246.1 hypothetical protein [Rhodococcus sp. IEGM 1354]
MSILSMWALSSLGLSTVVGKAIADAQETEEQEHAQAFYRRTSARGSRRDPSLRL